MVVFKNKVLIFFLGVMTLASGIYIAQEECPANEEYLLCGSACPFNCTNPEGPVVCDEDCIEGCFCKNNFLRNESGSCVPANQCISRANKNSVCDPNEEFLSCGAACPGTCKDPVPSGCSLACSMGCFCKSGYVRDEASSNCVTLDKCPAEQCLNPNEVYDICNASCEPSCSDPQPICPKICTGGCICSPGLLRDGTDCVSVSKCGNATDVGLLGRYMDVINKILRM